ncbi:hypothetical protein PAAG_11299 [Paracoccidioides lutzii Pb01]|uniref:Nephrocystin 3-like N-terminal domain-containing protein n=1 Tax=Paracoccidioides lutzii (strain ATCC MYA-826 / Pb01) TaxID=502779 RepID=A0A0A2VM16_PARBA|nr:hypothetical protein PAAG_11299 [Paracoccidioides lutzii Pb01]KGQ01909.1 hypothetical protein PAAG_11299 [Paracoccidioides lutzii Pb01]
MKPLSIVELIFLSGEIISICYTYCCACAENLRKLIEETTSLSGIFVAIQGLLDADRFSTSQKEVLHNVLAECQGTLRKLKDILQSLRTGPTKKKMRAMKRLLWPLKQAEATEILATLSRHKSSLNLLLALEATLEAQKTQIVLQELQQALEEGRTWVLNSGQLQWWFAGKYRLLWIHGTPGSGKTVLMSTILNQCLPSKVSEKNVVAYYYCDFRSYDSCRPESVVETIILQICHTLHCLPVGVQDAFSRHIEKDGKDVPASLEELEIVPGQVLPLVPNFTDQPRISTQGKDASEDIHYYIRVSVEGRPRLRKHNVVLQEHMVETLSQGAGGIRLRTDGVMKSALRGLFPNLDKTYERILNRISEYRDDKLRDPENILEICGSLMVPASYSPIILRGPFLTLEEMTTRLTTWPRFLYISHNCADHARAHLDPCQNKCIYDLATTFFADTASPNFLYWIQILLLHPSRSPFNWNKVFIASGGERVGGTPLHAACWRVQVELIPLLLRSGAELDVIGKNDGMPIDLARVAVSAGHEEVSRIFPEQRVIELRFHGDGGDSGHDEGHDNGKTSRFKIKWRPRVIR